MTDVTTYSAPVEDQDMGKVRELFDRALNALVDASSLSKTVEQLKTDLDQLKVQVTHYRNTIANQDDQITRLRQDRDAARTAQYQAEDSTRHQASELEATKRENNSLSHAVVRLNDRISEITKERDDAQFKLLELQEAHGSLSKKLDDVKGHMQSLFGIVEQSETKPAPEPVPEPKHEDYVPSTPTPTWSVDEPVVTPQDETHKPESYWPEDIKR